MNRAVPGTSSLANETMAMGQGNMQQVSDRTFAHETCFAKPYSHTTRPIRQPSAISNKSNDLLPYLPMNEGEFDASESMPTALQDKQSVQVHLTQSSSMTLDLPRCAWHASLPIPESVDNSNVLSAEEPQIPTLDERQPWNQDPIIFFHKPAIRQSRGDESIPSTMARHVETVVAPFRLNKAFDYNTGRKNLQEVSSIKEFSLCTKRSPIKVKHQCKILWHDRNEAKSAPNSYLDITPSKHRATIPLSPARSVTSLTTSNGPDELACLKDGCSALFTGRYRNGNLQRHDRDKHGKEEKLYSCSAQNCGRVFKRQDARLKHYRRHHRYLAPGPIYRRK